MRYFRTSEFACRGENCCGGLSKMDDQFIVELDELRFRFGSPLIVTSGYRCPKHNAAVSSTGAAGPHTTGRAADILIDRTEGYRLLKIAMTMDFTGIGFQQKGAGRFLHFDNLPNAPGQPRPTIWSYAWVAVPSLSAVVASLLGHATSAVGFL